ncbi:hypothetical protein ACMGGR_12705 [Erwinia sp. BNK-24-b]|uniref:hypothetical protein n=1 Tax=unclassified Erwinia TaxID=2622719 RepID=UPI0039BFE982
MHGTFQISLCHQRRLVVTLGVLTEREFRFSFNISQLLAKAIPVRGAKFKKPALMSGLFAGKYSVTLPHQ